MELEVKIDCRLHLESIERQGSLLTLPLIVRDGYFLDDKLIPLIQLWNVIYREQASI